MRVRVCLITPLCLALCNPVDQASLSRGFPGQEYWGMLPIHFPGDLSDRGSKPMSLAPPALAGGFFTMAPAGKPPCRNNALEILALKLKTCVILNKFLELSVSVSLSLKYWLLVCNSFLKAKLEKHHPPYPDAIQSPGRGSTWTNLKGDYDVFYFGIRLTISGRLLWILPPVQEQDHSLRH